MNNNLYLKLHNLTISQSKGLIRKTNWKYQKLWYILQRQKGFYNTLQIAAKILTGN